MLIYTDVRNIDDSSHSLRYSSGMGSDGGAGGGSSFGVLEGNEWAYGQANKNAGKQGQVLECERHAQFLGAIAHHRVQNTAPPAFIKTRGPLMG